MFNRRRITAALIGLLVLVLGGWLVKDVLSGGSPVRGPGAQFVGERAREGRRGRAGRRLRVAGEGAFHAAAAGRATRGS